jgi:hypothetical protein
MKETLGNVEITVEGDRTKRRVVLSGKLDESAPIAARAEAWAATELTLDTSGIHFINSIGVREWMRLLRGLSRAGAHVHLERCAAVIIEQINMIVEALGTAQVESFHAPYVCTVCGFEAYMLLDVARDGAAMRRMEAPPQVCPECKKPMELFEIPEKFFTFLGGAD